MGRSSSWCYNHQSEKTNMRRSKRKTIILKDSWRWKFFGVTKIWNQNVAPPMLSQPRQQRNPSWMTWGCVAVSIKIWVAAVGNLSKYCTPPRTRRQSEKRFEISRYKVL